jgi:shikimate dehydrogenase
MAMHNAAYRELALPFTYVPFEVTDLRGALAGMRALGIRGFGVSHPFKRDVMPLLDAIDPVAAAIGAVNTIVHDGATLVGHNTDWIGATRALEEAGGTLAGARVLLLGAGGAARAIAFGLRERGARTTIANRDEAKARALAAEVGSETHGAPLAEAGRAADYDVVVNATTVGMAGTTSAPGAADASPVPAGALREGQTVMDIVYSPLHTRLLADARARGARAVHGGRMLLFQAAEQFRLYTGRDAPLDAMERALRPS